MTARRAAGCTAAGAFGGLLVAALGLLIAIDILDGEFLGEGF